MSSRESERPSEAAASSASPASATRRVTLARVWSA
uniref:Uncharacterized protein n=1 Tax=Arundo donax TaxID=35708 RepID=A0A0A9D8U3_ARUDO